MTTKQRFNAITNFSSPDRPMLSPLEAQNRVWAKLYERFQIPYQVNGDIDTIPTQYSGLDWHAHQVFMSKIGMEFRGVYPKYIGPKLKTYDDGSWDGIWGERWKQSRYSSSGTYEETIFLPFAEIDSVTDLKAMQFPCADWFDYNEIETLCDMNDGHIIIAEGPGSADFINGIAFGRGVEQVLIDIATEDPVYLYLVEKRFEYTYERVKRTLEAAKRKIDIVRFGEDLGTQLAPIINPESFKKIHAPKYRMLFELVHLYGAKTMLHSCGSVRSFIPILIDLGLDILEVVQVDAKDMDIKGLHKDFHKKIIFSGSMSVQSLLVRGSPEEIKTEINLRKELFHDGGLIIGPTNIMQVDMPIENFIAMCDSIKESG